MPTKVHIVKAMVFPGVMYGYEIWTIKKAEQSRTDTFKLCCWRRHLRVPWTARKSVQFSWVAQSYLTLCNPVDCRTPGFPVHHQLLELTQIDVHTVEMLHSICQWIGKFIFDHRARKDRFSFHSIQPSHPLFFPFSSCPQAFPASGFFPMNRFFTSGGQSIGVSASTSVLPVNIQVWFPLGLTGWISLQSKGLSRIFSNTMVQKHRFFST